MKIALCAIATILPAGAVFITFTAIHTEIGAEPGPIRVFTVFLVASISFAMLRSMVELLKLPSGSVKTAIYVSLTSACIGVPFSFAAIYTMFQRTGGECIRGFKSIYDGIHFSYTTFTTLGYGDLSPVGICRVFTAVESLLGYLVLGLVVGILTNLFKESYDEARLRQDEEFKKGIWRFIEAELESLKSEQSSRSKNDE